MSIRGEAFVNRIPEGWQPARQYEARIENAETGEVLSKENGVVDIVGQNITIILGMAYTGPLLKDTLSSIEGYLKKVGGKVDGEVLTKIDAKIEKTVGHYRLVIRPIA